MGRGDDAVTLGRSACGVLAVRWQFTALTLLSEGV